MPRARIALQRTNARAAGRPVTINRKHLAVLRRLQRSEKCLSSKAAFNRITHEIMDQLKDGMRVTPGAVEAIQVASEDFLHKHFKKAALLAAHAGRSTITPKDFDLIVELEKAD